MVAVCYTLPFILYFRVVINTHQKCHTCGCLCYRACPFLFHYTLHCTLQTQTLLATETWWLPPTSDLCGVVLGLLDCDHLRCHWRLITGHTCCGCELQWRTVYDVLYVHTQHKLRFQHLNCVWWLKLEIRVTVMACILKHRIGVKLCYWKRHRQLILYCINNKTA